MARNVPVAHRRRLGAGSWLFGILDLTDSPGALVRNGPSVTIGEFAPGSASPPGGALLRLEVEHRYSLAEARNLGSISTYQPLEWSYMGKDFKVEATDGIVGTRAGFHSIHGSLSQLCNYEYTRTEPHGDHERAPNG